ncbi:MAG: HAD family phosphatase [Selenomonadaceae bacterium]|nr:HAD family phosphatase [Selenomonadaceae bacterium]
MIKIILSDMDGTLLDENSKLPAKFEETMIELKRRGVIFAPASGRQYKSLRNLFEKHLDEFIFISDNGTMVFQNDQEIFSSVMNLDEVTAIMKTAIELPNIFSVFCGKKNGYYLESQKSPEHLMELEKYYPNHQAVANFDEVTQKFHDQPIKLAFFDVTGHAETSIFKPLSKFESDSIHVVQSSDFWIDIANLGVSKGSAVQAIQKHLGIKPDECAAFGDYMNDFEMLQSVYYSFAMANAHPEIKKIARFETSSNSESGVIVGIQKLIEEGLI